MSRRLSHIGVTKTERKSACKLGVWSTDRQTDMRLCVFNKTVWLLCCALGGSKDVPER